MGGFRINGSDPGANPVRIWVQGALHGDEQATPDGVMHLVEMVLSDPELSNRVEVMVVPIANPDGYALAMRQSASGMDLNRDMMMRQGPENQMIMSVFNEFQRLYRDWFARCYRILRQHVFGFVKRKHS